jgi:hypothetical protein
MSACFACIKMFRSWFFKKFQFCSTCLSTFVAMIQVQLDPSKPPEQLPLNTIYADKTYEIECPDMKKKKKEKKRMNVV